jgi:hypothetical protein
MSHQERKSLDEGVVLNAKKSRTDDVELYKRLIDFSSLGRITNYKNEDNNPETHPTAAPSNKSFKLKPLIDWIPILPKRRETAVLDKFLAIQKWTGYIIEVGDDSVTAQLEDLTNEGTLEEAEFSVSDFDSEEQCLISVGAMFYWTIGYETKNGVRQKASILRFRRSPILDTDEIIDFRQSDLNTTKNL